MPVTARLSKKFYERFGDDIVSEFVDWFNAVDTTYQQQLRDLNDLNWERFKAELYSAITQSESRMIERMAQLEIRVNGRMDQLEARLIGRSDQLDVRMNGFESKFSEMMKWMFIYWSGSVITLGGLMIVLLRK